MIESNEVCAGIVLYNPEAKRLQQVIGSIVNQVQELILVDNGSANINELKESLMDVDNIHLISNNQNVGIATALNQIFNYGLDKGYKWCLTLDHDTVCNERMVSRLSEYTDNLVGIVCPRVEYEGMHITENRIESDITEVYACMTSGSLTNIDAWHKVGGFRDSYFIDYVDNEYCKRLSLAHYRIIRVNSCVMYHKLGEAERIKLFHILPVTVIRHAPWRYYYITRNNLLYIWEYKKQLNLLREYAKLFSILFFGLLYLDTRKEIYKYIKRGIKDAKSHKVGKMQIT